MAYTLLQINVTANWGSTGRIAEEIGLVAIKNGWESYIAYGRGKPQSKSKLIRIGNDWDMYEHVLETRLLDDHGLASRGATRRLIELIDKINPNIVHLHNIHGYFINYKILFEYLANREIPVVWTLHDCWTFTGHCSHFVENNCYQWRDGDCLRCHFKRTYPASLFLSRSHRNFLDKRKAFCSLSNVTMVPVSHWLEELVRESFLSKHQIRCIHNGVDVHTFRPKDNEIEVKKKLGVKQPYMLIGVASVWPASKGLADFVSLRALLPLDKYAIVLVGVDDKQAKRLPMGIKVVKRTNSQEELVGIYSAADVFLNMTYSDTFPTVNLEALASGTPVVTYLTGGSPEAVDKNTGIVVEQGNVSAVASAVEAICKNDKAHYAVACRQRAIEHFNKDDRFMDYIHLYEEILSNKANNKS